MRRGAGEGEWGGGRKEGWQRTGDARAAAGGRRDVEGEGTAQRGNGEMREGAGRRGEKDGGGNGSSLRSSAERRRGVVGMCVTSKGRLRISGNALVAGRVRRGPRPTPPSLPASLASSTLLPSSHSFPFPIPSLFPPTVHEVTAAYTISLPPFFPSSHLLSSFLPSFPLTFLPFRPCISTLPSSLFDPASPPSPPPTSRAASGEVVRGWDITHVGRV